MQTGLAVASVGRNRVEPPPTVVPAPGQYYPAQTAAAAPARTTPVAKPFQMALQRPTISPYINLYREEPDDSFPNYFAFVLPQIRQQEFAYQQQLELSRLQQQLQQTGRTVTQAPAGGTGGVEPHNYHARFMNTGHYFSGIPLPQPVDGQ
jgi:hypothetical protein